MQLYICIWHGNSWKPQSLKNIFKKNTSEEEDDIPLARLREVWNSETSETLMTNTIHLLQAVEPVSTFYSFLSQLITDKYVCTCL